MRIISYKIAFLSAFVILKLDFVRKNSSIYLFTYTVAKNKIFQKYESHLPPLQKHLIIANTILHTTIQYIEYLHTSDVTHPTQRRSMQAKVYGHRLKAGRFPAEAHSVATP